MKHVFNKELRCLIEIEQLIENTTLLNNKSIRKHFFLLVKLREELENLGTEDPIIIENILDDISLITKQITLIITTKLKKNVPKILIRDSNYNPKNCC